MTEPFALELVTGLSSKAGWAVQKQNDLDDITRQAAHSKTDVLLFWPCLAEPYYTCAFAHFPCCVVSRQSRASLCPPAHEALALREQQRMLFTMLPVCPPPTLTGLSLAAACPHTLAR